MFGQTRGQNKHFWAPFLTSISIEKLMHFALHHPTLCCALKDEQRPWSLTLNARCTQGAVATTTTCPAFPNAPPQGAVQPPLPGTEPASVLTMDLSSGARRTCLGLSLPLLGEQQNPRPLGRDHGQSLLFGDCPPDQRKKEFRGRNFSLCWDTDWGLNFHLTTY